MTSAHTVPGAPVADAPTRTGFRLSIRHLWVLPPFLWMAWIVGRPIGDNSFLWHVRAGTAQLDLGKVFTSDPFSFTAGGESWRTQSWLAELAYGYLENLTGGIGWVHIMLFLVTSLTLVASGLAIYRSTGQIIPTAAAMLVVAWQGAPFSVPRPVIFSYLALALVVLIVQRSDADLWILPPLIWVWAALHGSFVLGLGVIILDAIRRKSRRRGEVAGIALVFATLTAHGIGVWQILIDFLGARGALDLISEWESPDFSNPFVVPYAVVLGGVLVATAMGRIGLRDLILIGPFAFFGLLANRNLYPALIVLIPLATMALVRDKSADTADSARTDSPLVNWVFVGVMALFALLGFNRAVTLNEARFPDTEVLALLDEGPVFHGTAMGGYLIYTEWPDRLVFIDDRAELFGESRFRGFHDLRTGVGYEEVFAEEGIRQAILEPEWPLVISLTKDGWIERYRDEFIVIMATAPG